MDLISLPPPARNRCPHDTGAAALSRNDAFVAETVSRPGLVWLWPFLSRSSEKSIGENQCVVCVYRSEVLLAGRSTARSLPRGREHRQLEFDLASWTDNTIIGWNVIGYSEFDGGM